MKKNPNVISYVLVLAIILCFVLGCKMFSSSTVSENKSNTVNVNQQPDKPTGTAPESQNKKVENPDFTVKAEDYDKEFTRKGVTDQELKKYASKNIRVSGRVSLLSTEKKGTVQPWVTLYAPGTLHGVNCYFDDDNLEQMKQLKMDKTVTVQGFQDDFIVPEVSPRLEHCVVIKAD